ncbi:unnamed protein product [Urochloa humidicola]
MLNVKETEVQMVSLVLGQSQNRSSSVPQESSSISKVADGVDSVAVSAAPLSQQQQQILRVLSGLEEQSTEGQSAHASGTPSPLQEITAIPKKHGEASINEASVSVSVPADNVQKATVFPAAPSQQQQEQLPQITSALREPRGLNVEEQPAHASGTPSPLQEITAIPKKHGEASINEASVSVSMPVGNVQQAPVFPVAPSKLQQQQKPQITSVLREPRGLNVEEITAIPKKHREASINEASVSVSVPAGNVQQATVFQAAPPFQQQQQQPQITSVLREPRGLKLEVNKFVHDLVDGALSISSSQSSPLLRIADVRKGTGATSTEINAKLLDVYPLQICFPFEANKLIRCAVTLTNRTEHYVGVWIRLTYPDTRLGFRFPVMCGNVTLEDTCSFFSEMMGPHSTLAVPLTMKELRVLPPWDTGKFEVLMIVMRQTEQLKNLMKASNIDSDLSKRGQELGAMVHRVVLTATIRDKTSFHTVIASNKFMPKRIWFCDIEFVTDVHPTKTWFLARQKGGCVSIWSYQALEKVMEVQVTKVPSKALFGLSGVERDWRRSEHIKFPTSQNPPQSTPIPLDPLEKGIDRTNPRGGSSCEPQIHFSKNLPHQLQPASEASLQHHQSTHLSGVREDRLVKGGRLKDPGYSLPSNLYPPNDVGQVVGSTGWMEGRGSDAASTSSHRRSWGGGIASKGRVDDMAQQGYKPGGLVQKSTGRRQSWGWPGALNRSRRLVEGIEAHDRDWHRRKEVGSRFGQHGEAARTTLIGTNGGHGRGGGRGAWVFQPRRDSSRLRYVGPNGCSVVRSAKFIVQEHWLVAGDDDGWVHVYSCTTSEKVTEFIAHHDRVMVDLLSVHPTSRFLLTASSCVGTPIKLWDWGQAWECTRTFDVQDSRLLHLSWNPWDTSAFASVSYKDNNTLQLWKIDSADPISTMAGMKRAGYLCTNSQRQIMVTTSHLQTNDEKTAFIWDLQTEECVHRLGLSGSDIYDIACHPTLPILATSHTNGRIICLWDTTLYRLETIFQLQDSHIPGMIFFSCTEKLTRLVIKCRGGISTVEVNLPTTRAD